MKNSLYFVLRSCLGDCTNKGFTSKNTKAITFWNCTQSEALKYCKEHNIDAEQCLYIVSRSLCGEDCSYAEPLVKSRGAQMFGGNFIYTSDANSYKLGGSQFSRPIPVHDRFEIELCD